MAIVVELDGPCRCMESTIQFPAAVGGLAGVQVPAVISVWDQHDLVVGLHSLAGVVWGVRQ